MPGSVAEWLQSLRLIDYCDTFISHGFDQMERVRQLWELELTTVLDIGTLGHRKRLLASLGEKQVPVPDVTGKHIQDESVHIRPPHLAQSTSPVKQWCHKPEVLIKGCCNYIAQYLGSAVVWQLNGIDSTREGIAKMKKSTENMASVSSITLSISYKGVKFIDAESKRVVCEHEICNIFCACQDSENLNFFAYITKDKEFDKHYCHVFCVRSTDLARNIILTLGQAFEIAYQMALKEKAEEEALEFERKLSLGKSDYAAHSSSTSHTSQGFA
ncbi:ankyrin repeat and sterile alpha motif domain-containing protein 1B [Octopus bimaculoides]|uniref:PID domain-containing protein n=1 Tax=Octopus bimaculoides TaxID=37653 RepID=A0A0L8GP91_OCTBM|nr:ankyrin repeat and sterile alpha motif domain-containing protein 1B [Octopus bimaculoides]|eukprot:XP_014779375.1 PREDICTED: ankyrin repeat and sterile alpha motif domain-containing protein 1B-like [Octopus bimaculoides]